MEHLLHEGTRERGLSVTAHLLFAGISSQPENSPLRSAELLTVKLGTREGAGPMFSERTCAENPNSENFQRELLLIPEMLVKTRWNMGP